MYPMLLNPVLKNDIWGGTKLIEEFNLSCDSPIVSQAIMLSGKENSAITIKNGKLSGKRIGEVLSETNVPTEIKLVHTLDRTSIKVTMSKEGPLFNSDTLLYIADCDEDSQIIYGLWRDVGLAEFERLANANQISKICNYIKVNRGDLFVIPSKTIWAIGKGIVALQISPSCAKEYRIYDYGRKHADNTQRKLHLNSVINHINISKSPKTCGKQGEVTLYPFGTVREIFSCEKFSCELLNINGTLGAYEKSNMISILALNGDAIISYPSGNIHIHKGDSLLIPKDTHIKITGKAEFLYTSF